MPDTLPHQLKQTASDIWAFLNNPKDQPNTEQSAPGKLRVLCLVLLIEIIISFGLLGLIQVVGLLNWYNLDGHAVRDLMLMFPFWGFLLLVIIVIPLFEELIFRYGLRFRRGYITFLFSVILLVLGSFAFLPLAGALAVLAALATLLVLYLLNADAIGDFLEQVWPKMYGIVFYTVALLFGVIHIANFTNFDYASAAILLVPVLVAPQVWAGLLIGYMRVKHGFSWGYFLHASHNAFFIILGMAFMNDLEERLNIRNENYSLKVEEHYKLDEMVTSTVSTGGKSITMVKLKLSEVIMQLLQKERGLVFYDKDSKLHKSINLTYQNYSADTTQNNERILAELQELYKFEVITDNREQEIWNLEIEDSSMLGNYAVEDAGPSKSTVSTTEIVLENATLEMLLNTISNTFPVILSNKTQDSNRYSFKFANGDFAQLKEELKNKYGLSLQPRKELAEYAFVKFKK